MARLQEHRLALLLGLAMVVASVVYVVESPATNAFALAVVSGIFVFVLASFFTGIASKWKWLKLFLSHPSGRVGGVVGMLVGGIAPYQDGREFVLVEMIGFVITVGFVYAGVGYFLRLQVQHRAQVGMAIGALLGIVASVAWSERLELGLTLLWHGPLATLVGGGVQLGVRHLWSKLGPDPAGR